MQAVRNVGVGEDRPMNRDNFHYGSRPKTDHPRVLLIRPPQTFLFGVWPRGPRLSIPVGLLAIGSFLRNNGVEVSIYDAFVESGDFERSLGRDAARFTHIQRSGRSTKAAIPHGFAAGADNESFSEAHQGQVHFGASWDQIAADLLSLNPDIVGITNLFRENTKETKQMARLVKHLIPHAKVVVGGPNANAMPDTLLAECSEIDFIGLGDGEDTMLDLVFNHRGVLPLTKVRNLVFRDELGNIQRTFSSVLRSDLDEYGDLDYDLLRLERYFEYERNGIMARNKYLYHGAERAVSMVTSRGCPYGCTFCSIHIHSGKKFRRHSVAYLVSQVKRLVNDYGVEHIHFEDDNLTLDRDRFEEFLSEIIRQEIEFTWDTPNGVFAEALDESLMHLMKRAGCTYLIIGVESGDQWVIDNIVRKQPLKLSTAVRTFELAAKIGLDLHAFYIIGFPRETLEQVNRTLSFAYANLKQFNVVPHLSLARADPGTELYREAFETGTLASDRSITNAAGVRSDMFQRNLIVTEEFTPELLECLNDKFHRKCIRWLLVNRLAFLARHPSSLMGVIDQILFDITRKRLTIKQSLTKLFWCGLLYKNTMISRPYRAIKV